MIMNVKDNGAQYLSLKILRTSGDVPLVLEWNGPKGRGID